MIKFLLTVGSRGPRRWRRMVPLAGDPPIPVSVGDALLLLHRFEGTLAQLLLQVVVDHDASLRRSLRLLLLIVVFVVVVGRAAAVPPGRLALAALLMLLVFLVLLDMLLVFFVFLFLCGTVRVGGTAVRGGRHALLFVLASLLLGPFRLGVARGRR
uniref:(northern house mosquito) hypothetical protein n=1 Tax=Culex pipiens TaxID=7175 RepID=A0A8D8BY45_CULPI